MRTGQSLLISSAPGIRHYLIPVAGNDLHTWTMRPQLHSEAKALSCHLASLLVGSDGSFLFSRLNREELSPRAFQPMLPPECSSMSPSAGRLD